MPSAPSAVGLESTDLRARVLLIAVLLMLTGSLATAERRIQKLRADVTRAERIDMGITLHVVKKNPGQGAELIRGLPRMTLVETLHFGGTYQIGASPGWNAETDGPPPTAHYVGPSRHPAVWFASEQQARLIVHDKDADGKPLPLKALIEGSEGSGKTTAGSMWLAIQAIENIGTNAETGITAPTDDRLGHIRKAIKDNWPAHWYRYNANDDLYTWHLGPRFQCVSASSRSAAGGSPIQGFTWVRALSDELQDHFDKNDDIESRLRDPRAQGCDRRLCTSTMKDMPEWRTFREACRSSKAVEGETVPQWGVHRLLGLDSPFIFDRKWQSMRASGTMTEREWRRRILALDVGPEKQVYFNWLRSFPANDKPANLAHIPANAIDVTAEELRAWGKNIQVLAGHDPGTRQHVTEFLKAFRFPGKDRTPRWFVVGELTTPESTVHGHIQEVKTFAQKRWGVIPAADRFGNVDPLAPTMLVRIDPHTQSGEDHPGEDVYRAWRVQGIQAKPAAYAPRTNKGTPLKKRQRIDLLNTLFAATSDVGEIRRLFVAFLGADGHPSPTGTVIAAPMLVKALETMENDAAGRPETARKDANDLSHWPASVAFALWIIESRRLKWEPEEERAA